MPTTSRPVAVVGGGLAGLTAAIELARCGRDVTLFDQASQLGGRATTRQASGFHFNMGPHALYARGPARRILEDVGVEVVGNKPSLQGGRALWQEGDHILPMGVVDIVRADWLPWTAKLQLMGFFARLPKLDPTPLQGQRFDAWLGGAVRHPVAQQLVLALMRLSTYAAAAGRLDACTALRQLQLGGGGVLYLDGGWQLLIDGLTRVARESGVRLETSAGVKALHRHEDGWQLELAEGRTASADAVVLAVAPAVVTRLLGDALPAEVQNRLDGLEPVDAACLDIGLRKLPQPSPDFALGIDRPIYFSVHSATARLAPSGGALVHVLRYLDGSDSLTRSAVEQELESVLDTLHPGWRPLRVERQLMPKLRVCHALHDAGTQRVQERLDPLPGVYVAGDWVGDDGLLADAAVASGQKAARQLLARSSAQPLAA